MSKRRNQENIIFKLESVRNIAFLVDYSETLQSPNFEYGILDTETQIVFQQRSNEVKTLMRRNSQDIIAIGHKLIQVKQHLRHAKLHKLAQI